MSHMASAEKEVAEAVALNRASPRKSGLLLHSRQNLLRPTKGMHIRMSVYGTCLNRVPVAAPVASAVADWRVIDMGPDVS